MPTAQFTIGVEEEYQIIDPATRELRPASQSVLPAAHRAVGDEAQSELYLSQVEVASPVCHNLAEARAQLVRLRRAMMQAAEAAGGRIGTAGTHPFSHWQDQPITPKDRYLGITEDYQQLARENVIFGCHVHVGLDDKEMAVEVLNRVRVWLSPLLALAANSPFWLGADSGYASFRTELWGRWPFAGPPLGFESRAEYDALLESLVAVGAVEDATKIYWDVRLPAHILTVEFRVTDVCLTIDEAVMVAGLAQALTRACYEQAHQGAPAPCVRQELLRAAHWRAARYGLSDTLIDLEAEQSCPAAEVIQSFLHFVRPALEAAGVWEEVDDLVSATLQRGNGAMRQRAVYEKNGRLEDVVDFIMDEAAQGVSG